MLVVFVFLLLAACGPATQPADVPPAGGPATPTPVVPPSATPAQTTTAAPPAPESTPPAAACPDADAAGLAQSIAHGFTFTSAEEVLAWFCAGADFEDIIIALETEEQANVPAEEMLSMLAAGLTWEEIWQSIGLIE